MAFVSQFCFAILSFRFCVYWVILLMIIEFFQPYLLQSNQKTGSSAHSILYPLLFLFSLLHHEATAQPQSFGFLHSRTFTPDLPLSSPRSIQKPLQHGCSYNKSHTITLLSCFPPPFLSVFNFPLPPFIFIPCDPPNLIVCPGQPALHV